MGLAMLLVALALMIGVFGLLVSAVKSVLIIAGILIVAGALTGRARRARPSERVHAARH